MIPLLLAMAAGPLINWKRDALRALMSRAKWPGIAAGLILAAVLVLTLGRNIVAAAAFGVAGWLVIGSFAIIAHRMRLGKSSLSTSLGLLRTTPRAIYGLVIAHAGMGVAVAGITGMSVWATEKIEMMKPGEVLQLSGFDLRLLTVGYMRGANYDAEQAVFEITRNERAVARLSSERRFFPVRQQQTTVAGIRSNLISNLYVALGEPDGRGAWAVRFYYHPLAPWIWIGALMMAAGGFVSLSDRRFRVGAPQRSRRPAFAAVPA
jgi:cytochrome c-type biogenesis protein CcmF